MLPIKPQALSEIAAIKHDPISSVLDIEGVLFKGRLIAKRNNRNRLIPFFW